MNRHPHYVSRDAALVLVQSGHRVFVHGSAMTPTAMMRALAHQKSVSVAQLAIAWVLSRGDNIVPLVGARRREQLQEALDSLQARLDAADFSRIEHAVPHDAAAGERYNAHQMAHLDSER